MGEKWYEYCIYLLGLGSILFSTECGKDATQIILKSQKTGEEK